MTSPNLSVSELRRVVLAAAVGNVIEWYDFYVFGSLASILAVKFFEKSHPVAAMLSTVALFSVGFLIRPLGSMSPPARLKRAAFLAGGRPLHAVVRLVRSGERVRAEPGADLTPRG